MDTPHTPLYPPTLMTFEDLALRDEIVHAAQRLRFTEPTPIQAQAIPVILAGKDLLGSAQTGTGKTAAFALPILSNLATHGDCRVLVLEPTRELAAQVTEAFRDYAFFTDMTACLLHGGVKYTRQNEELAAGPDIVVATPGRLIDHLQSGNLKLDKLQVLVLDEADRMLDMGFMPDVRRIIEQCPAHRQTLLFSATLPPTLVSLISWAMKDPQKVSIGIDRSVAETVSHALYPVAAEQKFDLLNAILEQVHYESVIVFTRTKMDADRIHGSLTQEGHSAEVIHADRSQSERTTALTRFKSGEVEVLVATNIASRGLDIEGVSHVINYDVPDTPDEYVHRIGRTGRAQRSGDALTLYCGAEMSQVRAIEFIIGMTIPRKKLDAFPYKYTTLLDEAETGSGGATVAEAAVQQQAAPARRSLRQRRQR